MPSVPSFSFLRAVGLVGARIHDTMSPQAGMASELRKGLTNVGTPSVSSVPACHHTCCTNLILDLKIIMHETKSRSPMLVCANNGPTPTVYHATISGTAARRQPHRAVGTFGPDVHEFLVSGRFQPVGGLGTTACGKNGASILKLRRCVCFWRGNKVRGEGLSEAHRPAFLDVVSTLRPVSAAWLIRTGTRLMTMTWGGVCVCVAKAPVRICWGKISV